MRSSRTINKFFIAALSLFLWHSFASTALAGDLIITCTEETQCTTVQADGSAGTSLFNQDKMLPGGTVTAKIDVINQSDVSICNLTLRSTYNNQKPADFSSKLFLYINDIWGIEYYGDDDGFGNAGPNKTLADFFIDPAISLGSIPQNSTNTYNWIVTFDSSTGNAYQAANLDFDFATDFACDPPPVPAGNNPGGGNPGAGDAGDNPLDLILGAVGNANRWFMGAVGEILGEEDEAPEEKEPLERKTDKDIKGIDDVLGAEAICKYKYWWILLIAQAFLCVSTLWYDHAMKIRAWFTIGMQVLWAAISQIVHDILVQDCSGGKVSLWYLLLNLGLLLLSLILFYLQWSRRKRIARSEQYKLPKK